MSQAIAPGSRLIARDEEWLVRMVDRTPSGAQLLTVTGLSPLVRDREAKFIDQIEALEDPIQIVDPKETKPVQDASPYSRWPPATHATSRGNGRSKSTATTPSHPRSSSSRKR
jgi:hypothetical protein